MTATIQQLNAYVAGAVQDNVISTDEAKGISRLVDGLPTDAATRQQVCATFSDRRFQTALGGSGTTAADLLTGLRATSCSGAMPPRNPVASGVNPGNQYDPAVFDRGVTELRRQQGPATIGDMVETGAQWGGMIQGAAWGVGAGVVIAGVVVVAVVVAPAIALGAAAVAATAGTVALALAAGAGIGLVVGGAIGWWAGGAAARAVRPMFGG